MIKGNIGPGLFAMGDAYKNGGYVVAPVLIIVIAFISVHCQYILINAAVQMKEMLNLPNCSDYAETVELCFENGPQKLRKFSRTMKGIVNIFICFTQIGFCCIYIVFVSSNMRQILRSNGIDIDVHYLMALCIIPILLTSQITNLKWLTPVSMMANVFLLSGLGVTLFYALKDGIPSFDDRNPHTSPSHLALFFGTAIYAFEGIALVLPLKNEMRDPQQFDRPLGVLNVGMVCITALLLFTGFFGYLKWGPEVGGSLTLNLGDTVMAQCVKAVVSLGVLFSYSLQFYIPVMIMWPCLRDKLKCTKHPVIGEMVFRTFLVLMTLCVAELVPALGLFISFIGALCSTALALVFPAMIEMIVKKDGQKGPGAFIFCKNIFILCLALLGFASGTYESLAQIIKHFGSADEYDEN